MLFRSGRVTADPSVVVHALYRVHNGDKYYEAAVPTTPSGKDVVIPFDATTFAETGGAFVTGIALANLETTAVNVTCTAKDAAGNPIANAIPARTLPARGHWADFNFPALVGKRGIIECTSPGNISGVSLRFSGAGSFFSLPVSVLR